MRLKKSQYNFLFGHRNHEFLYNSFTNHLIEITKAERTFYESGELESESQDTSINALRDGFYQYGFLVSDEVNELKEVKEEYFSAINDGEAIDITITPTMKCNFSCSYCFQNANNLSSMTKETEDVLHNFFRDNLKDKKVVNVTWFGGEPLLDMGVLERLSEHANLLSKEYGFEFLQSIISNGYLLKKKYVDRLNKLGISNIQITLDGIEDIHNETRPLRGGYGSYEQIMKNLPYAAKHLDVNIRINVNKKNADHLEDLLLELDDRGLKKSIAINLALTNNVTEFSDAFGDGFLSIEEYSRIYIEFYRKALEMGFDFNIYPKTSTYGCAAVHKNGYMFSSDGYMFNCWNEMGDNSRSTGKYTPEVQYNSLHEEWKSFSPFDEKQCLKCTILPLCFGVCPFDKVVKGKKHVCPDIKFNLIDLLKLHLDYKSSGKDG
jgi:uncharacterized protein